MKETALQAKHNGGTPPLGYSVNSEKRYEIIPEEAEAVKLIFRSALQKYSYREICDSLNQKGYRTKKGFLFRSNSLFDILRNPKYCGRYVFGRTQGSRKDPRNNHANHAPIVELEDAIPAIIPKSEWEEVQTMMTTRKMPARGIKGKTQYLLTGYITCECGAPYCGAKHKSRVEDVYFYYYKCNRRKNGKDTSCGNPQIRCEELDNTILNELWAILEQPEHRKTFIEKIIIKIIIKINKASREIEPDLKKMEQQKESLQKKLTAYTNAIGNGATYLAKEAQETHNQIEALSKELPYEKTRITK